MAVLVDARLAFFGIDQQELLRRWRVARGFPLGADRKVCPATTAQPRVHDELPHAVAAQALGAFERCVASAFERTDAAYIFQEPPLTPLGPQFAVRSPGPA